MRIAREIRLRKGFVSILMTITMLISSMVSVQAAPVQDNLPLTAQAAILVEQSTGKILYAKDADKRMYPASMTKIATALVVMDYLKPDQLIQVGKEIETVPSGSSMAYHSVGEYITVQNLLRGLMIPSGNDTGIVLALNVARAVEGRDDIGYIEAEKLFAKLMNDKAKELGATSTNFVNPHGFHDSDHYTTAIDLAILSRKFMENPVLAEIVKEKEYNGNGAGYNPPEGLKTKEYKWKSHNELIIPGDYYYPYATGIKTGVTDEAGDCVAASAEKNGIKLVAVVFNSPIPSRWVDAATLFDYGFDNFGFCTVTEPDTQLETLYVANPQLGADNLIDAYIKDGFSQFMKKSDVDAVVRTITYNEKLLASEEDIEKGVKAGRERIEDAVYLKTPISKGDVLGKATFTLYDEVIFESDILTNSEAVERTSDSDYEYYKKQFMDTVFTLKALPFWIGGVLLIVVVITLIIVSARARSKRNRYRYKFHRRY